MNLQDLVTGNVELSEEFSPLAPLDAKNREITLEELEVVLDYFEKEIKTAEPTEVPYLAAQLSAHHGSVVGMPFSTTSRNSHLIAATHAHAPNYEHIVALLEWSEEIRENLHARRKSMQENATIGSPEQQLIFLAEFFPDDLPEELAFITGTTPATCKKWVRSGFRTSWGKHNRVKYLAQIFYHLRYQMGMSDEDAVIWYSNPYKPHASSARDLLGRGTTYGSEFNDLIRSIDLKR